MSDPTLIIQRIIEPRTTVGGIDTTESNLIKSRLTAVEAEVIPDSVDDLITGTAATGQVPVKQAGGGWAPGTISTNVAIHRGTDGATYVGPANRLDFGDGLWAEDVGGALRKKVYVQYAGTGAATSSSRSDHTHSLIAPGNFTFLPLGYQSAGTRTLKSQAITLPAGATYVVRAELRMQIRGGDPGACYYQLSLNIDGNVRTSVGGSNGWWAVQGVPDKPTWVHSQVIVGTGQSVTITASSIYFGGGGFYTDAGEVEISLTPNR